LISGFGEDAFTCWVNRLQRGGLDEGVGGGQRLVGRL